MNNAQWDALVHAARGERQPRTPVALIVDSPWIPPFVGSSTVDYISVPDLWFEANLRIVRRFPDVVMLPGFWVEPGMAAEPSGFGCRIQFHHDQPPSIHAIASDIAQVADLETPNPRQDGLMPIVLSLYRHVLPLVRAEGMDIRVVAARGPLALAAHLLGLTSFLVGLKTEPALTHRLLRVTTRLVRDWLTAQAEILPGAEGIMVLDDVIGFLSREDFREFAEPCLREVFSVPATVKILHDDTDSPVCYEFLESLGVNVFNFTHLQGIREARASVGDRVCLMGNVAPRDVLAQGTPIQVAEHARRCLEQNGGHPAFLLSAGGGVSPGTSAEAIDALAAAVRG